MYCEKTTSYPFQAEAHVAQRDLPVFGKLWDQGTGKTKSTIDEIGYNYLNHRISVAIILAPKGVHHNWILIEIPKHLPDDIPRYMLGYSSDKANTQWQQRRMAKCLEHSESLVIVAMPYDSVRTNAGYAFLSQLLMTRKCYLVSDESTRIKSIDAELVKRLVGYSNRYKNIHYPNIVSEATMRRILNGTPITQGPFDLYAQFLFLDSQFWLRRGIRNYHAYKHHFGVIKSQKIWTKDKQGKPVERNVPICVEYRNLDQLKRWTQAISQRIIKEEVLPDLPDKTYSLRIFEMSPKQARVYRDLKKKAISILESGHIIAADTILTLLIRLHQVTSGYIPLIDIDGNLVGKEPIDKTNPRLEALMDDLADFSRKMIIWAHYHSDIEAICDRLGDKAVHYYGPTSEADRLRHVEQFKTSQTVQYLVASPAAACTGHNWVEAHDVIYYNCGFNAYHRWQSEDRVHRIGQEHNVNYTDYVAYDTIDFDILHNLRRKFDISTQLTGDQLKSWLDAPTKKEAEKCLHN